MQRLAWNEMECFLFVFSPPPSLMVQLPNYYRQLSITLSSTIAIVIHEESRCLGRETSQHNEGPRGS